MIAIYESTLFM